MGRLSYHLGESGSNARNVAQSFWTRLSLTWPRESTMDPSFPCQLQHHHHHWAKWATHLSTHNNSNFQDTHTQAHEQRRNCSQNKQTNNNTKRRTSVKTSQTKQNPFFLAHGKNLDCTKGDKLNRIIKNNNTELPQEITKDWQDSGCSLLLSHCCWASVTRILLACSMFKMGSFFKR